VLGPQWSVGREVSWHQQNSKAWSSRGSWQASGSTVQWLCCQLRRTKHANSGSSWPNLLHRRQEALFSGSFAGSSQKDQACSSGMSHLISHMGFREPSFVACAFYYLWSSKIPGSCTREQVSLEFRVKVAGHVVGGSMKL
jgi:hypothetical protein